MSDQYVAIIIPTHNCIEVIDKTIESALEQDCGKERIRVVVLDNCSNDGTYERALQFAMKYPEQMAIFRLTEPTKLSYVLKKGYDILHLQQKAYVDFAYSLILYPGEYLASNMISSCIALFEKHGENFKIVVSEVQITGETEVTPLQVVNNIIDRELHIIEIVNRNVKMLYRGIDFLGYTVKGIVQFITNYNLYFSNLIDDKALYLNQCCCVKEKVNIDYRDELFARLYNLKMKFLIDYQLIQKGEEPIRYSIETMDKAYKALAQLALKYARQAVGDNEVQSGSDCLEFARMICLDIEEEKSYIELKNIHLSVAILSKYSISNLMRYLKGRSIYNDIWQALELQSKWDIILFFLVKQ